GLSEDGRAGKARTASWSASQATPSDPPACPGRGHCFWAAVRRRPRWQSPHGLLVGVASDAFGPACLPGSRPLFLGGRLQTATRAKPARPLGRRRKRRLRTRLPARVAAIVLAVGAIVFGAL